MRTIATAIICILLLSSCTLVHKTFSSHKEYKDSNSVQKTDSSQVKHLINYTVKYVDSTHLKKDTSIQLQSVVIEFADSSTDNHVEVTTEKDGQQIIKASGKIKDVKGNSSQHRSLSDSIHGNSADSSYMAELDSLSKRANDSTVTHTIKQDVSKQVKRFGITMCLSLLSLLLALLILGYNYRDKLSLLWNAVRKL